jgi:hypothetical protein
LRSRHLYLALALRHLTIRVRKLKSTHRIRRYLALALSSYGRLEITTTYRLKILQFLAQERPLVPVLLQALEHLLQALQRFLVLAILHGKPQGH